MVASVLSPHVTPPDYFTVVSSTLRIASEPQVAIPVGLLACQRCVNSLSKTGFSDEIPLIGDPLLKELKTTIVSCVRSQVAPASTNGAKKVKKSVITPELPPEPLLEVVLHDTVIFPEGGGQPTDTGVITTISDGQEWEVVQAKRHSACAVHYIRVTDSDIDAAILAFSPGGSVIVSLGQKGWDNRYDHMTMHTSQHLLSALLETHLNLPTLSWSLTSYPSPCYVEIPRGMTRDEIMSIQNEANRLVFEGRRVRVEVQELDKDQEKVDEHLKLENGRTIGKALPNDYTGGVKRVVIIDGVDRNPCCGTHLPSIYNLQLFLLPHTEALSRSSTTCARLYFIAGSRLIAHLSSTHGLVTDTASTLSCGALSVPARVNQVIDERKRAEKRVADLESELAKSIASEQVRGMKLAERSLYKKHIHRVDDATNPLGFLNTISVALTEGAVTAAGTPYLFVLTSSPSGQMSTSTTVILVFGSDEKIVKEVGEHAKSNLGVKGGGKGQRWSGKFNGVWKQGREDIVIENMLQNI